MYCSQCGKKVMDTMLFCPFCGSPIVIPDQDEECTAQQQTEKPAQPEMERSVQTVESNVEEMPEAAAEPEEGANEEFIPLKVETMESESQSDGDSSIPDLSEKVSDVLGQQLQQEPVKLHGLKPDLSPARQFGAPQIASPRKSADTFVPQRKFDPNDMFMDSVSDEEEYEDEYDEDYDERDESGFWVSHIRGLVALALLLVVAAVLVGWSFSNSGQQSLARADLAWRPSAYAEIAFDAYQKGQYSQSGRYYSKAVAHDADNYDYASSAGVAYYMAQDTANAEAMARLAIQIDPSKMSAYDLLLRLYPDAALRPLEIQSILQKGYELTGESRLAPAQ